MDTNISTDYNQHDFKSFKSTMLWNTRSETTALYFLLAGKMDISNWAIGYRNHSHYLQYSSIGMKQKRDHLGNIYRGFCDFTTSGYKCIYRGYTLTEKIQLLDNPPSIHVGIALNMNHFS